MKAQWPPGWLHGDLMLLSAIVLHLLGEVSQCRCWRTFPLPCPVPTITSKAGSKEATSHNCIAANIRLLIIISPSSQIMFFLGGGKSFFFFFFLSQRQMREQPSHLLKAQLPQSQTALVASKKFKFYTASPTSRPSTCFIYPPWVLIAHCHMLVISNSEIIETIISDV